MLWIPEGFAHGFLVLEDDTHFFIKQLIFINKTMKQVFDGTNPDLAIEWPKCEPIL